MPLAFFNVGEFYDGVNTLGEDEELFAKELEDKGRCDLSTIVRKGKALHRFLFCCGYDLEDWDGFIGLFKGLREIVNIDAGLEWKEWKTVAVERYGHELEVNKHEEHEKDAHE